MALAAVRHKFLDGETNIGTSDLRNLTDNAVYTAAVDVKAVMVRASDKLDSALVALNGKLKDVKDIVSNMSKNIADKVSSMMDKVVNSLLSIELPPFVTKALDKLKGLNLGGVKSFFKDVLSIGSSFLCSNLDLLKNFMLGYSISRNILSGLLLGLTLSWMDKFCKGFSGDETAGATNKGALGQLLGGNDFKLTKDNVIGSFMGTVTSVAKGAVNTILPAALPVDALISKVRNGESLGGIVTDLAKSELSYADKNNYMQSLADSLDEFSPTSKEYGNILQLRGDIKNLPIVSYARQELVNATSHAKDALGSMALSLKDFDTSTINLNALSSDRRSIVDKLNTFKSNVSNDFDLITRDRSEGGFSSYDFSKTLPTFTPDELETMSKVSVPEETFRYNGLHPTTMVFIEEGASGKGKQNRNVMTA